MRYFLNMSSAWLFVFNTRSSIYSKCKSLSHQKSVMNKPQAEGKVNSSLYSRTQKTSQVTYVTMVPRVGNKTLRPLGSTRERRTHPSRRERHAHRWPSMVRGAMLARPYQESDLSQSSGKWRTHPSEGEETQTLRRERHAHRWPSMVRGAMLARPTRRATYNRALGGGETQTLRRERHAHRWP